MQCRLIYKPHDEVYVALEPSSDVEVLIQDSATSLTVPFNQNVPVTPDQMIIAKPARPKTKNKSVDSPSCTMVKNILSVWLFARVRSYGVASSTM
ncbi:hypothetical protein Hamer_G018612 [Homarus americanus]|uniref:Uncharacterized protein n=1 Tax=Homarus americanus TaxID=6706 RepID=A0A8J5N1H4_HOMAM|nr:hypothetical protein Hamer_G018612 [Homarus americanus]